MLLMVFTMNATKFGIPLEQVEYIAEEIGHIETTIVSEHIRGTTILRDEVIMVYNLASRFGYDISKEKTSFIVISKKGKKLAIEVERMERIKYWEKCICEEIPIIVQSGHICVKQAVSFQGEMILALDLDKIFEEISWEK